ncbi:MAG: hypothetical protein WBP79_08740 [Candidatus Acidiferrales bacterium]
MEGMGAQAKANSFDAVTEESIGEHRLWTAVILKAVEDWRFGSMRARREAQQFLFEDDRDFTRVCASAGLDPDSLRSKLLKIGKRLGPHVRFVHPLAA